MDRVTTVTQPSAGPQTDLELEPHHSNQRPEEEGIAHGSSFPPENIRDYRTRILIQVALSLLFGLSGPLPSYLWR